MTFRSVCVKSCGDKINENENDKFLVKGRRKARAFSPSLSQLIGGDSGKKSHGIVDQVFDKSRGSHTLGFPDPLPKKLLVAIDVDEDDLLLVQENSHANVKNTLTQYRWWLEVIIYTIFVLGGQSVATILGRLYYDKGGNSMWMATLVINAGFPILLPLYLFSPSENQQRSDMKQFSSAILASIYISFGIFLAAVSMLYAVGLLNLPVSIYTLICATQLGFNALFSFFLNSQKLTPLILNSVVLLMISSMLLVFTPGDSLDSSTKNNKYALGILCTIGASAGYALLLSLTQIYFQNMIKSATFRVVVDMTIYQSAVATCVVLIALFVSGEWKSLCREMREFELGSVSYVMILVWTAVFWQVFSIGVIALIYKVSSLFSNVICALGFPVVLVLAVIILNDKMNGVKLISLVLAISGLVSYLYQHYLDDLKVKAKSRDVASQGRYYHAGYWPSLHFSELIGSLGSSGDSFCKGTQQFHCL
ncbi:putative purine permease [Heracleum sosnowskyi]|uniref:Probable purine permease n=1 Tax=Heracleum sosnowskyi TaxID=360622 RepID=A0AAD8GVC9_9APIA|nr:putative purine permease [Heracleum sosnowskyi]